MSAATPRTGAATRQNLVQTARRLERVRKGSGLLRRKREALVSELFRVARPAVELRTAIAEQAAVAYPALAAALADEGCAGLRAIGWPGRSLAVEIRDGRVWGIPVAEIVGRPALRRTLAARGTPPAALGAAAATAATEIERLGELLLDAAGREALLRRVGEAVSRTSRQVNVLEYRVTPALTARLAAIRRTLDEREREEHLRLQRLLAHRRPAQAAR
ncbi:MAG: V-type ATP synthase subunit D [bacterium]